MLEIGLQEIVAEVDDKMYKTSTPSLDCIKSKRQFYLTKILEHNLYTRAHDYRDKNLYCSVIRFRGFPSKAEIMKLGLIAKPDVVDQTQGIIG